MFTERTSVGLDVHARSVVAHAMDVQTGEIFKARLCPDPVEVTGWIKTLPGRWNQFKARKKRPIVANAAIARELAGWCWSLAVLED